MKIGRFSNLLIITLCSFLLSGQVLAAKIKVAGIYTQNISKALSLSKHLDFGSIWINGWFVGGLQAPTGGVKMSGIGRERGLPGILNYVTIKNIGIKI